MKSTQQQFAGMVPIQLSGTFTIKEQIKAVGGKWDPIQKYWYVPETAVEAVKAAWRASKGLN
jgi:hypothetical protein